VIPTYRFDGDVTIVNLGDLHRGSNYCDNTLLNRHIKRIADDDSIYWVSTGDMMETAIKNGKSSPYQAMSPEDEAERLSEEIQPIAGKCLGFVASNHPNRIKKEVGLSFDKYLAGQAQLPFLGVHATIKVVCGRLAYFINLHHGVGGGTEGNKVNRAIKLSQNQLGCDIYMTGHTHSMSHVPDIQRVLDRKRDKYCDIEVHHLTTGHYLHYEDHYPEEMGLKKKPKGCCLVHLTHNESGQQQNKVITPTFWTS